MGDRTGFAEPLFFENAVIVRGVPKDEAEYGSAHVKRLTLCATRDQLLMLAIRLIAEAKRGGDFNVEEYVMFVLRDDDGFEITENSEP